MPAPGILVAHSGLPTAGKYYLRYPNGDAPVGAQLAAAALVGASVSAALTTGSGGGGQFIPAGSQSITGTIADGQVVTLNGAGFGTKPYASNPLLWAPLETQLAPSSLGRVTAWNPNSGGLTFSGSGGPTGLGCATGSGTPGPGGTGVQTGWALGFDIDNWAGWSGNPYALNSYGQKTRISRGMLRHAMGYLAGTGSTGWNTKNYRAWARTGGIGSGIQGGGPDFYAPPCNGRFDVEGPTGWQDWPSPDYNGDPVARALYESPQDQWFKEEIKFCSNSSSGVADANYNWQVYSPGFTFPISNITKSATPTITSSSTQSTNPFQNTNGNNEQQLILDGVQGMTQINGQVIRVISAGGSPGAWTCTTDSINTTSFGSYAGGGSAAYMVWNFPNTSYQRNSWKFLNAANSGLTNAVNGGGNILQSYPAHYVIDGTSGRNNAPLGSYPEYAHLYQDDSWMWVVIQDTPYYYAGAGIREPQIVTVGGWTNTAIQFHLRRGMMASGSTGYVFTTDNNDVPTYQGKVIWP